MTHQIKRFIPILVLLLTIHSFSTYAQNARFSQPWSAPLMLNPAVCGNYNGNIRGGVINSWQSTRLSNVAHLYAFVDGHLRTDFTKSYWGFGLSGYNYGSDPWGLQERKSPVDASFFSATAAYHINLQDENEGQWLSLGVQVAAANARVDESIGVYDKEISGGGFAWWKMQPPPSSRTARGSYAGDVNLGAAYSFTGESVNGEMGMSVYHLFAPNVTLSPISTGIALRRRMAMHATLDVAMARSRLVLRNYYWQEGMYYNSKELDSQNVTHNILGFELQRLQYDGLFALDWGLYTRSFKTYMPYVSLHVGNANIRASYESYLPTKIKTPVYTARRFEISLILKFSKQNRDQMFQEGEYKANYW